MRSFCSSSGLAWLLAPVWGMALLACNTSTSLPTATTNSNTLPWDTLITRAPDPLTNVVAATFSFTSTASNQIKIAFECSLDGGAFVACQSPVTLNPFGEGQHQFAVRAVSGSIADPSPALARWRLDSLAPTVELLDGPPALTNTANVVIVYSFSEDVYTQCQHNDQYLEDCQSPIVLLALDSGLHVLQITGSDLAGNKLREPLNLVWEVDLLPSTYLIEVPEQITDQQSATLSFFGIDDHFVLGYECSLDQQAYVACESPLTVTGLSHGQHQFSVRAIDNRNQRDASPAQVTWLVSYNVAPDTYLRHYPSRYTPLTTVVIQAASPATDLASFICSVDGNSFTPCASTLNYVTGPGEHRVVYAAVDSGGVVDSTLDHSTVVWTIINADNMAWQQVAVADQHACAIQQNGTLWCWGSGAFGKLGLNSLSNATTPTQVGSASDWTDIACGEHFTCGIRHNQSLYCWGQNLFGQVGVGDSHTTQFLTPQPVSTSIVWTQLTAGAFHACALDHHGWAWCWGYNGNASAIPPDHGRLGIGSTTPMVLEPTRVVTSVTYGRIAAGSAHTCAIHSNGLDCFGANDGGQLGNGQTTPQTIPIRVSDGTWLDVVAGGLHSCGIRDDDRLWCWGAGAAGQLGNGVFDDYLYPTASSFGANVSAVAVGDAHSCLLSRDRQLYCFGDNAFGQLGFALGSSRYFEQSGVNLPTQIGPESNWLSIASAPQGTCGIRSDHSLWCWGSGLFIPHYALGFATVPTYVYSWP